VVNLKDKKLLNPEVSKVLANSVQLPKAMTIFWLIELMDLSLKT